MKMIVILLTTALVQVQATGLAQNITVSGKEIPLVKMLSVIEKQTDYMVVYSKDLLQGAKAVTFSVRNMPVKEFLAMILQDQPLEYSIHSKTIIISERTVIKPVVAGPLFTITGIVRDAAGHPLSRASVKLMPGDLATFTIENGAFSYSKIAPGNYTIEITYVGFQKIRQKITITDQSLTLFYTMLPDIKEEKEVVVSTGYQELARERATGSFELVTNEELNRRVGTDILSRLEGVTNSIFFDRRTMAASQRGIPLNNIIIRGLSTLSNNLKSPLVVVDNFPYEGDVNNINPNDVENITILRDAAAASIWGAKAANGVIVITTKKGQFNQPAKLSMAANVTITETPDLFKYRRMSASDFIDVEIFLFGKGFFNSVINNAQKPALSPVTEILLARRLGQISAADSAAQIDGLRDQDVRHDFEKYIYRTSITQQYSLNLSGGSDKIKYYVSGGIDKTPGILRGEDYKRVTFNSDNSFTPLKKLTIRAGVKYAGSEAGRNTIGEFGTSVYSFRGSQRMPLYTRLADDQGNFLNYDKDFRPGYTDTAGGGKLLNWKYSPLRELNNFDRKIKQQEFVINTGLNYQLTSYVNFAVSYQYLFNSSLSLYHHDVNSFYARDLINRFTNLNTTVAGLRNPVPIGGIMDDTKRTTVGHSGRGQVNFNYTFHKKHQVAALAGADIRETITSATSVITYGYDANKLSSTLVDFTTRFPRYGNLGPAPIPSGASRYSKTTNHMVSLFANAAYTYDDRYTISGSARRDAANQFGVKVNDQWKPFWSVGTAWNISNESFFKIGWIPFLSLKSSFGYQGNVNNTLSPYTILSFTPASSTVDNLGYSTISSPANPGLSWETIEQVRVGLDFRLLANRISGGVEWYQKSSKNLILAMPIDPTSGVQSVQMNSAGIKGKGVDITLSTINIDKPFRWNTEIMFSYVSSKVTKLVTAGVPGINISGLVTDGTFISPRIGIAPYALFSYPWAGLDPATGDPRGYLGKEISKNYQAITSQRSDTAKMIYHGSAIATVFGNVNNIFSYRDLTLQVSISYKLGYYFRKAALSYQSLYSNGVTHYDYINRWQQPGDEQYTNVPSAVYPSTLSDRDQFYAKASVNSMRGDHIRLESIRLAYELKRATFKKLPVRQTQFFVSINNLGLLWAANKEKMDPDYDGGNGNYPPPKTLAMGLRVDF